MALLQAERQLHLSVEGLKENELLLISFSGQEEMSRLFHFQLEMISDNNGIKPADVVGRNVTFSVEMTDGSRRFFNGHIIRFAVGSEEHGRRNYRAEVVPWLWFLSQTTDCRIFQEKTVPDIIRQVLQDLGFSAFEMRLNLEHKNWEYCVQYRETDLNFVCRLAEQEGIFFFFRHEEGRHVLVFADHKGAYENCTESEVNMPFSYGDAAIQDHLTSWEHRYEFCSGRVAQKDYNFETPMTNLMANRNSVVKLSDIAKYEVYDYPGEYYDKSAGQVETNVRMEEIETRHDIVQAASTCKSFTPGGKFRVAVHTSPDEVGKTYVITSIHHSATEALGYETGGAIGQDYGNAFTCIPHSVVYRPARITPPPVISGVQTAVVVGPKGEEIYTDQYGRVKVQFHWDREGKKDEKSSCWIRTAQQIAGKRWGFMAIPRIGQEVVVHFIEGDPDRPLIVGEVYNADQMPHYSLPSQKTKSYIKTNSSIGGDGHNEIRFEDLADQEQVYLHAERNMDTRVKHDRMELVANDRHLIVGQEKEGKKRGDQCEMVYQDKNLNVKRNQVEHVEGNMQLTIGKGEAEDSGKLDVIVEKRMTELIGEDGFDLHVKGNRHTKIDKSDSLAVGGSQMVAIGGNHNMNVKSCIRTKMGKSMSLDIGENYEEKTGTKHAVDAGQEIHLKAGMKVIIEAGAQLSLVGPGGFIDIGPAGVSIQGVMVLINSGGAAGSGSGASPEAPDGPAAPREALIAAPRPPVEADNSTSGQKSAPD